MLPTILSLILPAYNEARRLPASLIRCREFFRDRGLAAEVIVVDDGSTDGTAAAFGDAARSPGTPEVGLRYERLEHRGKGAAVRAGVLRAAGDPIVFLDADLTIPVETIDELLAALARGADIAVASRYAAGSRISRPWWRGLLSDAFRMFVRLVLPTGVRDTQCGGKAYRADVARALFSRQRLDGFAFDAEVLFLARRAGYRVAEVPVRLEQHGATSIDFVRDTARMFGDLVRVRWLAALGRYG